MLTNENDFSFHITAYYINNKKQSPLIKGLLPVALNTLFPQSMLQLFDTHYFTLNDKLASSNEVLIIGKEAGPIP